MISEVEKLRVRYEKAAAARGEIEKERRKWEEFYLNDVESTLSQFTKGQKDFIDKAYKIPVSTKLCYPIVEILISMLTGSKPFPKIGTPGYENSQFSDLFGKAYHGVWYESKGDRELRKMIQDAFVVGSGFIRVRRSNFFNESTFNTVIEHVPWEWVYVDPQSKKNDFSDAQEIWIARGMTKEQAEKEYDVSIGNNTGDEYAYNIPISDSGYWANYEGYGSESEKGNKYVPIIEGYIKEEKSIYISENGDMSLYRPKQIMLPNKEKEALGFEIEQLLSEMDDVGKQGEEMVQLGQQENVLNPMGSPEEFGAQQEAADNTTSATKEMAKQGVEILDRVEALKSRYYQLPDEVPGFRLTIDNFTVNPETKKKDKATVDCYQATRVKRKFIKRVLLVANHLLEKEYLKTEKFPIHHLSFQHANSPNKTYGTIHKIYDLINANNKFWSMLIYDMQVNNNRRVLYARGTIENRTDTERAWRLPNSWIEWIANPSLPNAGEPKITEASPLNQATVYIIQALKELVEYVTGIYGVMQGNSNEAPETLGATQSLQNYGSQRPKLYARELEYVLEDLAYSTISFLQAYAPKEKVLHFFDMDGDSTEIELLKDTEDILYKVRVNIVNSLPTQKQLYAQMLTNVAGQTQNPDVADALTQTALLVMDMPEGKKLAEDIDVIKGLRQQLQQAAQQIEELSSNEKNLRNQLVQKDTKMKVDKAVADAREGVSVEEQKAKDEINNQVESNVPQTEEVVL